MQQIIRSINIHRFRSFDDVEILADQLNIFSGKNNSGKSNILRALNLFFNSCTDYNTPFDYDSDHNKAFRGAAGGKRSVRITVNFLPVGNAALSSPFSITKVFVEGMDSPDIEYHSEDSNIEKQIRADNGTIKRQFTFFLNKLCYLYIPAVRDKNFIRNLFLKFEQIAKSSAKSAELDDAIERVSAVFKDVSISISEDFNKYIGLSADASLSSNVTDLLNGLRINVHTGLQERTKRVMPDGRKLRDVPIDLFSSGDGIIMSYMIYFLYYLTRKSTEKFIWGFEEPENSLEFSKVEELAERFYSDFSQHAQIFVTTHSPAFINLRDREDVAAYRVYKRSLSESDIAASNIQNRQLTYVQDFDTLRKQRDNMTPGDAVYATLNEELHLAEQSSLIGNILEAVRNERIVLQSKQEEFNRKMGEVFPEKVFICEDEDAVPFWKKVLEGSGCDGLTVLSSNGCTNNMVEVWLLGQKRRLLTYNPKVFREVDRDGLSEGQVEFLLSNMPNRFKKLRYRFSVLPVSELENFAVMASLEDGALDEEDFFRKYMSELYDAFESSTAKRISVYHAAFRDEDELFPHDEDKKRKLLHRLRDEALEKKWELFPGKDLTHRLRDEGRTVTDIQRLDENVFPGPLRQYVAAIKEFFDGE